MAVHFLDSSAGVKYYVTEPGSTWIRQPVDSRTLTLALSRCLAGEGI